MPKLRPLLNYTGFYRRVASWNDLCRIGRAFILYRIALQQYGVTFISPTERSDFPLFAERLLPDSFGRV